jgi:putative aldouronate transport system permease protein
MLLPGLVYFVLFRYTPLWYAQIAFRDFQPLLGAFESPWVGLKHLYSFFDSFYFERLLTNTLVISGLKLVLGMLPPIILAIAIHEVSRKWLGRVTQTVTYLPHFLSWVIVSGIILALLSQSVGLVNQIRQDVFNLDTVNFLTSPQYFPWIVVFSDIWKETGWSAILYLAALIAIDPTLYEAAEVDGASRWQRVLKISLPGILSVIVLVLLLRLGSILDAGFTQIFVLLNPAVLSTGDIIDTWVYDAGIRNGQISLAAAVGLFKGLIGLALVLLANRLAKRWTGGGIY